MAGNCPIHYNYQPKTYSNKPASPAIILRMNQTYALILEHLKSSAKTFADTAKALSHDELFCKPNDGWTTHQIISHVMEVETLAFMPRIKLALAHNGAVAAVYSPEEWLNARYTAATPVSAMLAQFTEARQAITDALAIAPESDWQNHVAHPQYGKLTVAHLASHVVDHTYEHLTDLWRARTMHV